MTSWWARRRLKSPASRLFTQSFIQTQIKEKSKPRVTGLSEGNSPVTGEFPAQRASNAENVSIWWCHHGKDVVLTPTSILTEWLVHNFMVCRNILAIQWRPPYLFKLLWESISEEMGIILKLPLQMWEDVTTKSYFNTVLHKIGQWHTYIFVGLILTLLHRSTHINSQRNR